MESSNKHIFITGATGLVGSYLARLLLKKGYRVRGLKRAKSKMGGIAILKEREKIGFCHFQMFAHPLQRVPDKLPTTYTVISSIHWGKSRAS